MKKDATNDNEHPIVLYFSETDVDLKTNSFEIRNYLFVK